MNEYTISRFYSNVDNTNSDISYHSNRWLIEEPDYKYVCNFLATRVLKTKLNYKCRKCNKKIFEEKQIQTMESYYPVYHIKCYMYFLDLIMEKISKHKELLKLQIGK